MWVHPQYQWLAEEKAASIPLEKGVGHEARQPQRRGDHSGDNEGVVLH
jgi:hypothetical protein